MSDPKDGPETVRFHYLKSPAFHTVHADGAIGGVTPRGNVHLAFYCERAPIPTVTVHQMPEPGQLGPEIMEGRVIRDGIVRELGVDVVMDIVTARGLHRWLGEQIQKVESALAEIKAAEAKDRP